ncbi:MAG: hypothetical protein J6P44_05995 [Bacteroidales bacterium]|nr:hypothetical protein [Bacteroidales bacterium]
MKKIKNFLFIALCIFAFAACSDDDSNDGTKKSFLYSGYWNISVRNFSMDELQVQTALNFETNVADITLLNVYFSTNQDKAVNFKINGCKINISDGDTMLVGAEITPSISIASENIGARNFYVKTINATIKNNKIDLSGTFSQSNHDFTVKYDGVRKK